MTIAEGQAEDGGEALAREAAHWFARMRSPDAEDSRGEFEAWLAEDSRHRAAYNRTSEIFAMGKLLAEPGEPASAPIPTRRHRALVVALAVALAFVVGIGGWMALRPSGPGSDLRNAVAGSSDHRRISTIAGEARVVRLGDGSTVHLGDQTVLDVDIAGRQRSLRLVRGQARFEVAHEPRPFIVFAGGGSVTARGTIFEVALMRTGKVDVRLLQGAVDVALPREASAQPAIRKLAAGEGVSFVARPEVAATPTAPAGANAGPSTSARDFDATPVAELVTLANHGAARPIRLADASLAGERVSGRLRVDDTGLLAQRLGALFALDVDMDDPRVIVLTRRGPASASPGDRPKAIDARRAGS